MVRLRAELTARLRNLAVLELANTVWIGWVVFVTFDAPMSAANAIGYGLAAAHLITGAMYWAAKLRQLGAGLPRPPLIGVFRWLRPVCAVGLAAGLVVIAAALASGRGGIDVVPGAVLYGLAAAEYVNYFQWQLMHDTCADWRRLLRTRRLHRSHLYEDIRVHRKPQAAR
ncbi:multidrug transporter [Streptomyces sp. NPDC088246]|uniref:multidrug transporter n=1 Tax=Streptomyces sp. NPDC088246 TaxID=3365842 RepID=UPI0037F459EF